MPKGDNPNSRKNLVQNQGLSRKEAEKKSAKGGRRSGEVRRAQASFTESLKSQLDEETMQKITAMLIKKAEMGNLEAMKMLRDQMGEKPTEKVSVSTVNEDSISKLQKAIEKRRANE